jgi:hypothetical protein
LPSFFSSTFTSIVVDRDFKRPDSRVQDYLGVCLSDLVARRAPPNQIKMAASELLVTSRDEMAHSHQSFQEQTMLPSILQQYLPSLYGHVSLVSCFNFRLC